MEEIRRISFENVQTNRENIRRILSDSSPFPVLMNQSEKQGVENTWEISYRATT